MQIYAASRRRLSWQPAAFGQLVAETSPDGHHTAVGHMLPRQVTRPEQPMQATHIAARVVPAARSQMRRDWLLVDSDIRLRAGVLSHWLQGRQPTMTAEVL